MLHTSNPTATPFLYRPDVDDEALIDATGVFKDPASHSAIEYSASIGREILKQVERGVYDEQSQVSTAVPHVSWQNIHDGEDENMIRRRLDGVSAQLFRATGRGSAAARAKIDAAYFAGAGAQLSGAGSLLAALPGMQTQKIGLGQLKRQMLGAGDEEGMMAAWRLADKHVLKKQRLEDPTTGSIESGYFPGEVAYSTSDFMDATPAPDNASRPNESYTQVALVQAAVSNAARNAAILPKSKFLSTPDDIRYLSSVPPSSAFYPPQPEHGPTGRHFDIGDPSSTPTGGSARTSWQPTDQDRSLYNQLVAAADLWRTSFTATPEQVQYYSDLAREWNSRMASHEAELRGLGLQPRFEVPSTGTTSEEESKVSPYVFDFRDTATIARLIPENMAQKWQRFTELQTELQRLNWDDDTVAGHEQAISLLDRYDNLYEEFEVELESARTPTGAPASELFKSVFQDGDAFARQYNFERQTTQEKFGGEFAASINATLPSERATINRDLGAGRNLRNTFWERFVHSLAQLDEEYKDYLAHPDTWTRQQIDVFNEKVEMIDSNVAKLSQTSLDIISQRFGLRPKELITRSIRWGYVPAQSSETPAMDTQAFRQLIDVKTGTTRTLPADVITPTEVQLGIENPRLYTNRELINAAANIWQNMRNVKDAYTKSPAHNKESYQRAYRALYEELRTVRDALIAQGQSALLPEAMMDVSVDIEEATGFDYSIQYSEMPTAVVTDYAQALAMVADKYRQAEQKEDKERYRQQFTIIRSRLQEAVDQNQGLSTPDFITAMLSVGDNVDDFNKRFSLGWSVQAPGQPP